MGIPNDVPWYSLLAIGIVLGIHDTYRSLRLTIRQSSLQICDYAEDSLDSLSLTVSKRTDDFLYQIGASKTSHIPRTFPRFKELPAEIRASIWKYALPGPRIIEIRHPLDQNMRLVKGNQGSARSICRIPRPLHVSREARREALEVYELAFGLQPDYDLIDGLDDNEVDAMRNAMREKCMPKIYVDFKRDTIYFGVRSDFYGAQRIRRSDETISHLQGLEKIRYLALRTHSFGDVGKFHLAVFNSVKEIVLIAQERSQRRFDLGKEPTLDKRSTVAATAMTNVSQHVSALDDKLIAWSGDVERWEPPRVSIGSFVKVKGDRWHCKKRGPRWMF